MTGAACAAARRDSSARVRSVAWLVSLPAVVMSACDSERGAAPDPVDIVQVTEPMAGQIVVSENNPAWFRYAGGRAHFLAAAGDPEDFLYRGELQPDGTRRGDQQRIIQALADSGVNGIYVQAVRSHGGDGDATHNPFVRHKPRNGVNSAVLDQWEEWLRALDSRGIVTYFFFYDDSARIWNTGDAVGAAERQFIVTLVKRFQSLRHLVWVIAEEYQEVYTAARVSRLAQLVREADEFAHPISVHKLSGLDFAEFADDPNIDQFAIQYNVRTPAEFHAGMIEAGRLAAGRYNLNMSEALNFGTGEELREKAWSIALGGAYVMVLYMDGVNTPRNDLEDLGRLARFMESTDFTVMQPAPQLAAGGAKYVLADAPRSFIAFAPANSPRTIGLAGLASGAYRLRWFDPASGAERLEQALVAEDSALWPIPEEFGAQVVLHAVAERAAANRAPMVRPFDVVTEPGRAVPVRFAFQDDDGPGPYSATVVDPPAHGTFVLSGLVGLYTPASGFTGEDRLTYRVFDGRDESEHGEVRFAVRAAAANVAPVAVSQKLALRQGERRDVYLTYDDVDGPGPYAVEIVAMPTHGRLEGSGNDRRYVPEPTFTGSDRFTWRVYDGRANSNIAVVEVSVHERR